MVQRSVRKEPNKERKVGLIGCRRRAILWSPFVIRECENASPSPRTSALLRLPLYRHLSSPLPVARPPAHQRRSASSDDTLVHSRGISIFEFGGRAGPHGRWPDITRILESLRTSVEFDPRIPEVAPKIPRLSAIPFLSARASRCASYSRIGIREIRSFNNRESEPGSRTSSIARSRACSLSRAIV